MTNEKILKIYFMFHMRKTAIQVCNYLTDINDDKKCFLFVCIISLKRIQSNINHRVQPNKFKQKH